MTLTSIALLSLAALIFVIYFGTRLLGKVRFLSCRGAFFRGVLVLLILAAMLFGYFEIKYPRYSWHQKMSIEIETPAGIIVGSGVTSVWWRERAIKGMGMGAALDVSGEAIILELGEKYLLALLKGAGTTEYIGSVAAASLINAEGRVINFDLFDEIEDKRGRAATLIKVPPQQYPLLVTFTDINDPASVQRVDPNDLAAHFGPGVKLKTITLEITNEPVTRGRIEKVLEWLHGLEGGYLHGGFSSRGAPLGLYGGNFKVGD